MAQAEGSEYSLVFGPDIKLAMERLIKDDLPELGAYFAVTRPDTDGVGYIGFGNYDKHNIHIFIACEGKNPPMRLGWKYALRYAFEVAGCKRMTSMVNASNTKALRMNKIFGLKPEGVVRMGNKDTGEDVHLFGYTIDDYEKYLERKNGKVSRPARVRHA